MTIRIHRGLTIDVPGAPEQTIFDAAPPRSLAVVVGDELEALPELCIEQGASVRPGAAVFRDSGCPDIRFTAPVGGHVSRIHRGARRRLRSVVIASEPGAEKAEFDPVPRDRLTALDAVEVRTRLLDSGLWTAIRSRPFDRVPHPQSLAAAILVTAIDTNPLACDPGTVIAERRGDFVDGINALRGLTERLCVCKSPSLALNAGELRDVEVFDFAGPHPAGLPGTHVAHLAPVTESRPVWYLGYQDVMAIGELFTRGTVSNERVVAIGGAGAVRPRLVRTQVGASIDELLAGEIVSGSRVILGSFLAGREAEPGTAYLGRYELQVTLLPPAPERARKGAAALSARLSGLMGHSAAMLPLEKFERLWPLPQPVLPLLRALLVGDADRAVELGCLDLAEEDFALIAYACPGRIDYGAALRGALSQLRERG